MDYQPMDQVTEGSSNKVLYVVVIIVVIAIFAIWYFAGKQAPVVETQQQSAVEQSQLQPLSSGNTTADISSDLNQIPNTSPALDADAAASSQSVQGF